MHCQILKEIVRGDFDPMIIAIIIIMSLTLIGPHDNRWDDSDSQHYHCYGKEWGKSLHLWCWLILTEEDDIRMILTDGRS